MNLFLRLVLVWLKRFWKPPIGLLDTCTTEFRVWFTDQDAFRHMTNSRYFSLTDVCIVDYMLRSGAWARLRTRGWIPVVIYEDLVFLKPLKFPQGFAVETRFLGWDDTHVVAQHVFVRNGQTTAEGFTVARFISRKGEKLATAPVLDLLGQDPASPALPPPAAAALARARDGYRLRVPA